MGGGGGPTTRRNRTIPGSTKTTSILSFLPLVLGVAGAVNGSR